MWSLLFYAAGIFIRIVLPSKSVSFSDDFRRFFEGHNCNLLCYTHVRLTSIKYLFAERVHLLTLANSCDRLLDLAFSYALLVAPTISVGRLLAISSACIVFKVLKN